MFAYASLWGILSVSKVVRHPTILDKLATDQTRGESQSPTNEARDKDCCEADDARNRLNEANGSQAQAKVDLIGSQRSILTLKRATRDQPLAQHRK